MRARYVQLLAGALIVFCGCDDESSRENDAAATQTVLDESGFDKIDTQPTSDPPNPPLVKGGIDTALPLDKEGSDVPAFQPLLDARVGEWATYTALESRALRYEIAEIDGATVRTRVMIYDRDKLLGQPAIREDHREVDLLAKEAASHKADRHVTRASVEVMVRTWDVLLYEDRWVDEEIHYVRKSWVSNDVPVFGLLRMELYGDEALEARIELSDYGPRSLANPDSRND